VLSAGRHETRIHTNPDIVQRTDACSRHQPDARQRIMSENRSEKISRIVTQSAMAASFLLACALVGFLVASVQKSRSAEAIAALPSLERAGGRTAGEDKGRMRILRAARRIRAARRKQQTGLPWRGWAIGLQAV
jgi:hypothetical protein